MRDLGESTPAPGEVVNLTDAVRVYVTLMDSGGGKMLDAAGQPALMLDGRDGSSTESAQVGFC